ncbi:zinc ribbon domain-containing protein [Tundrisphaera sp. TA3]|uniref:zinc ribbon domain-containing protein n=1 Tax=Tundrisphaera sp. TA3 TaxID=3435775 RepID=UPI003EBE28B4
MFCPECGTQGGGKFCTQCGTRLAGEPAAPAPAGVTTLPSAPAPDAPPADWSREARHDILLAHPEVRALLKVAAKRGGSRVSGEQLIRLHDKYLAKLNHGIKVEDLASVVAPALTRLGVKTGKQRSEVVPLPIGHATVATLCALAARGIAVEDVEPAGDGCVMEATIPPDLLVYQGTLAITLADLGDRTRVEALTRIGGQFFDWGKSTRLLDGLLAEIRSFRP